MIVCSVGSLLSQKYVLFVKLLEEKRLKSMQVKFEDEIKEWKERKRVRDILEEFGLNREEVIVIKGDVLLTENEWVEVGEKVEIWKVVSGG